MQRTEEKRKNANEKEEIIWMGSDGQLYASDGHRTYSLSVAKDEQRWDIGHIYPKKKKKRKKGFDREITRVAHSYPTYRQANPIHQQFPNTYQRADRKDRV
jgi:hypothetical protein